MAKPAHILNAKPLFFTMDATELIEATRTLLVSWGGNPSLKSEDAGYWLLSFPTGPDAAYSFEACIYTGGEVQIRARRVGGMPDEYFWYLSYEKPEFANLSEMHENFTQDLITFLSHDSRIIHHTGMLFRSFECQYLSEGSWRSAGGNNYFRWGGFDVPPKSCGSIWNSAALGHMKHNPE